MSQKPDRQAAEARFTDVFREFSDAIFRHCAFKTMDRALAHDLTQETFLRAWRCMERGDEIENMRAFLYRVADNLVIDHIRKHKSVSLEALQEQGFDPTGDDGSGTGKRAEMGQALQALSKLEEPYRSAIHLRYVEGMSVADIAQMSGEAPNTVSVRLHRGLAQLRSHLRHG